MRLLRFAVGLVIATVVEVLGLHFFAPFGLVVDPFLILVVYTSLDSAPAWSIVGGSVAGLSQDALTGGLYGLHGFADTLVGWVSARLKQHMVIQRPGQVGLLFALAAGLQQALLAVLQFLMVPGSELPGPGATAAKIAVTGVLGAGLFVAAGRFGSWLREWRRRRRSRLTIEV
ncbi:MAG: rod shape-determining protein MreD [bacterium]|nr:rod shape-determining protein MreD [bacterium]